MFLRTLFIKIIQIAGYFFAAVLISSAVLVSTAHFLTPLLNQHRTDFEQWASILLDMPVAIKEVHADWRGYIPELSLYNVVVLDKRTHKPAFKIREIHIGFHLFSSLWQKQIVLQGIIISGTHFTILQDANGKFSIKDLPVKQGNEKDGAYQLTDILGWIFSQHYIALHNIEMECIKHKSQKRDIVFKKMVFWNQGNQHKIQSNILLRQEIPTEIKSNIEWVGNIKDIIHTKGQAHLKLEGFSLSQWLEQEKLVIKAFGGWRIRNGIGRADVWLDWENQELKQAQSIFQWYDLALYSTYDKKTYPIHRISGHVGWKKDGSKQIFAGDNLLIDFTDHFWPATTFYVALTTDEAKLTKPIMLPRHSLMKKLPTEDIDLSYLLTSPLDLDNKTSANKYKLQEIRFGYLDIQDVLPIVLANADLPMQWRQYITALKPSGSLQNMSFTWHSGDLFDFDKLLISGNTKQLSFRPWKKFPGITNLTGVGAWDGKGGNFCLDSVGFTINWPSLFAQPLIFDNVSSYVAFGRNPEGSWTFQTRKLNANNADLNLNVSGQLTLFHTSPTINLKGDFIIANANRIFHYSPIKIMNKDLAEWLKTAFISGYVDSGKIVIQGELNDFPYDKGMRLANNNSEAIHLVPQDKGGLFKVSGRVKDMDFQFAPEWPVIRQANGDITFAGRSMNIAIDSAFIFDVPLQKTIGIIADLNADHPILDVQGSIKTNFARALEFIHQSPLQKTIGKDLESLEIQGPMNLNLSFTVPLDKPEQTKVLGKVNTNSSRLVFPAWNISLNQLRGDFQLTESDINAQQLQGLLWGEPVILQLSTIPASQSIPTCVQAKLTGKIDINRVQAFLSMPLSNFFSGSSPYQLVVRLYQGDAINNQLLISSDLEGVNVDLPAPFGKAANIRREFLLGLDIQEMAFWSLQVKYGDLIQAHLNISKNSEGLRNIDIDSNQLKGRIRLAYPFDNKQPMVAQLEKMIINAGNGKVETTIEPHALPPLNINIKQFIYGDKNIGQLVLITKPKSDGMVIEDFSLGAGDYSFKSHGQWTGIHETQKSQLQGTIESYHVKRFLQRLGLYIDNFIVDKGKASFDLQWPGAPYSFNLAAMSGNFSFALEKGRIINLTRSNNNKMDIGRVLSLFSLQTIPRRLSGDFSDLFEQGYSFDFARGSFVLKQGNAYIQKNIVVEGPVAHVTALGRIGLLTEDYDLSLNVSPYVTESLPVVAGAITLNPFVGAAAWLVNKMVLSKEVSKAITYHYIVTGPWSNPVWQPAKDNTH